jgi:hypothetical protein
MSFRFRTHVARLLSGRILTAAILGIAGCATGFDEGGFTNQFGPGVDESGTHGSTTADTSDTPPADTTSEAGLSSDAGDTSGMTSETDDTTGTTEDVGATTDTDTDAGFTSDTTTGVITTSDATTSDSTTSESTTSDSTTTDTTTSSTSDATTADVTTSDTTATSDTTTSSDTGSYATDTFCLAPASNNLLDVPARGSTMTVSIPGDPVIVDLDVSIKAYHTEIGAVRFELRPPNGTAVDIVSYWTCAEDGFDILGPNGSPVVLDDEAPDALSVGCTSPDFDPGTYQPNASPLSTFDGLTTNGDWRLGHQATFWPGYQGGDVLWDPQVFEWCLTFTY